MSTQTQAIVFCVIAVVSIPLGMIVAIKCIRKTTLPPENVLRGDRSDIELIDYIAPTQPQQIYNPRDFEIGSGTYECIYQDVDRYNITCWLENENIISLELILLIILFIIFSLFFIIFIKKEIISNKIRTYLLNNRYFLKKATEQNVNLENFNLRKTLFINISNLFLWILWLLVILYLIKLAITKLGLDF